MVYTARWESPLGEICLASEGAYLTGLWFRDQAHFGSTLTPDCMEGDTPALREAARWLAAYFAGQEPDFCPPVRLRGTAFQLRVWAALREIPYGQTVTYGELAARLSAEPGMPGTSARAVGGAVGRNPVSLIVPCHRVIGVDGSLTGYAGGVERKRALLRLEQTGFLCYRRTEANGASLQR